MKVQIEGVPAEEFVKKAFWLAWKACGRTVGLGLLQDNPNATEEDVWFNVRTSGDYFSSKVPEKTSFYADYVFGRMMKLGIGILTETIIRIDTGPYNPRYQSFAFKYENGDSLLKEVCKTLNCSYKEVE